MNPHVRQTITPRIRTNQTYSDHLLRAVSSVFDIGERVAAQKAEIAKDANLSEAGRQGKVAELVRKDALRALAHASRPIRGGLAHIKEKREALRLPQPDSKDVLGESKRKELREFFRSIPQGKRAAKVFEMAKDPRVAMAVIDMPPELSGIEPVQQEQIRKARFEAAFGAQLKDIDGWQNDYSNAESALSIVRKEIQQASGLTAAAFDEAMRPLEAEADKA